MNYGVHFPCSHLKDYVSHFWTSKMHAGTQTGLLYHSTANTNIELAFAFKRGSGTYQQLLFSAVQGHTTQHAQFTLDTDIEMFGVSVYSHAALIFFDVSPTTLADQMVDIETLLGYKGKEITRNIINAVGTQNRIKSISDYFRLRLVKNSTDDKMAMHAIKEIRQHNGIIGISALASKLCLSQKQFERRFRNYTGFNPKSYSRIIRFESALSNHRKYNTLSEVAHAYGYYDQAHFISDFKAFSGYTPSTFFSLTRY